MRLFTRCLPRVALFSATLIAVSAGPVFAESACKGLEQAVCESNGDCTWVNGYTRKDNKQVSGHCKSIGKQGSRVKEKSSTEEPMKTAKQSVAE